MNPVKDTRVKNVWSRSAALTGVIVFSLLSVRPIYAQDSQTSTYTEQSQHIDIDKKERSVVTASTITGGLIGGISGLTIYNLFRGDYIGYDVYSEDPQVLLPTVFVTTIGGAASGFTTSKLTAKWVHKGDSPIPAFVKGASAGLLSGALWGIVTLMTFDLTTTSYEHGGDYMTYDFAVMGYGVMNIAISSIGGGIIGIILSE